MKLAVCCWVYFDPVKYNTTHPSARTDISYSWESIAKLLLGIDSQKCTFCSVLGGCVGSAR
eukprot:4629693-Ditylum_brightwellii.AAC.1